MFFFLIPSRLYRKSIFKLGDPDVLCIRILRGAIFIFKRKLKIVKSPRKSMKFLRLKT